VARGEEEGKPTKEAENVSLRAAGAKRRTGVGRAHPAQNSLIAFWKAFTLAKP
jgi:hypothetical protein